MTMTRTTYDVGGVLLDRPFKIRRLGHFGFNVRDLEANVHFYCDLLGFRISDLSARGGYFCRYGSDHHALVLFDKTSSDERAQTGISARHFRAENDINQITWQIQSRGEIVGATQYFRDLEMEIRTEGRAGGMGPGSNFHLYVWDPDDQINELFYGIEQIGWDGHSKPIEMRPPGEPEVLHEPHISEFREVQDALVRGGIPTEGYRYQDPNLAKFEVDGILMPRPFKVVRIGPVKLFCDDLAAAEEYYRAVMGFTLTEEVEWHGERCVFLRCDNEHHALGLFPKPLRAKLGLSSETSNMSFGLQLANYRQLRDAVTFLRDSGVRVETAALPPELHPGMDYAAYAFDPDGHCIELYYYMEQVGWDGSVRPPEARRKVDPSSWPETLEPLSDTYHGEPFLGPWA